MTRLKRKKDLASPDRNDVRFGTPQEVAEYRAQRIAAAHPAVIIEAGAGAGFQTAAFARHARTVAIEIDSERIGRAQLAHGTTVLVGDALDPQIIAQAKELARKAAGNAAVFLDPERPASSERRTLDEIRPDIRQFISEYSAITGDIAIELPPFLQNIPFECEREYLSIDGKLNRLTIYLGKLKRCDISVVQLPGGERFEHSGELPIIQPVAVEPRFIIEPDAALAHAGLAAAALGQPYDLLDMGKRSVFITERPAPKLFRSHKVIAAGKQQVERALQGCGTLILHGSMSAEGQRATLRDLRRFCKGDKRMHLFLGKKWYLTS